MTLYEWLKTTPFATATWNDWIDVALLTWGIYRGLLLIRGTRAAQSLIGLAMVAVMYVASAALGLSTIHWLLDNLFVYLVLAVIILFQEDIRRALARAGGSVFTRRTGQADANLLEEVIQAVFELARRKIGALIAIERKVSLNAYVDGAQAIEGRVSTEILQSIFHPSSPLHDGAVVVAENRIAAAGVFLPITLSRDVSKTYGTRHRAAIGLTEATDAIALVVSEERGTVSVVEYGQVTPVADADDLRERLQEVLGAPRKKEPAPERVGGTVG